MIFSFSALSVESTHVIYLEGEVKRGLCDLEQEENTPRGGGTQPADCDTFEAKTEARMRILAILRGLAFSLGD